MQDHHHLMQMALNHAARMEGQTWPNPCVGAALVKDGQLIAIAATGKGGRPHAEANVLAQAGDAARGATLYVTLEPCAHQGQTPPCVDAIIKAGVARVVMACEDVDPRTAGKAAAALRAANIEVIQGILEDQARWQHRGFFSKHQKNRPWITLKMAPSLDGKVALANGDSKWITGEQARYFGHRLRAQYDAILSTSRSIAKDDAKLTCRLPGLLPRTPLRVVIDRNLRLEADAELFQHDYPIWVLTYQDGEQAASLPANAELCHLARSKNWLEDIFDYLAQRGLTKVLVETGGTFASALLGAELVDELQWFTAPMIIGEEGISAVRNLNKNSLEGLDHWQLRESRMLGTDRLDVYIKQRDA